jgi:hypothetical protein
VQRLQISHSSDQAVMFDKVLKPRQILSNVRAGGLHLSRREPRQFEAVRYPHPALNQARERHTARQFSALGAIVRIAFASLVPFSQKFGFERVPLAACRT